MKFATVTHPGAFMLLKAWTFILWLCLINVLKQRNDTNQGFKAHSNMYKTVEKCFKGFQALFREHAITNDVQITDEFLPEVKQKIVQLIICTYLDSNEN